MLEILALVAAGSIIGRIIADGARTREARHTAEQAAASRLYRNPVPRAVAPSTRPYLGPRRPRSLASRIAKHNR